MEKFLIMSDLDRTLLNKKSKISWRSKHFIKKLEKKGHYFIMATGRPYQGSLTFINDLRPSIIVCDNGGSIHFINEPEKSIFTTIDKNLFLDLIREIKPYILAGMSSDYKNICMYNPDLLPFWMKHIDESRHVYTGDLIEILNHNPINPNLFIKRDDFKKVTDLLDTKYSNILSYRYWDNPNYPSFISLEIFNKACDKGIALDKLKAILKIKSDNDLAFGDSLNDIEMLIHAHNGVAMLNARPEVKEISKYITDYPNYKNGEIKFIKKFLKEKKAW